MRRLSLLSELRPLMLAPSGPLNEIDLHVEVRGDLLIVTVAATQLYAIYAKPSQPQLILRNPLLGGDEHRLGSIPAPHFGSYVLAYSSFAFSAWSITLMTVSRLNCRTYRIKPERDNSGPHREPGRETSGVERRERPPTDGARHKPRTA